MDGKGSESNKVDDTLASIKLLQSEISVVIASIGVISREIHELTDDKLLPELYKLIDGYATLSSFLSFIWIPFSYVISRFFSPN